MTMGCFESCFYYSEDTMLHTLFVPPVIVLLSFESVMQLISVPSHVSSVAKLFGFLKKNALQYSKPEMFD